MSSKKARNRVNPASASPKKQAPDANTISPLGIPGLFIFLYLLTEVIPPLGAIDVMGTQWLYLTMIDLLAIIYIVSSKGPWTEALRFTFQSRLARIYLCYFIICGLSIFFAVNRTESFVCYARFLVAVTAFFIIAVFLYNRLNIFEVFAKACIILLFIQSLGILIHFFKGYGETDLNQLILGLKGNGGNKNNMAAILAIKLPFLFYGIYKYRSVWKVILASLLFLALFAIILINSRAMYLGVLAATVLFLALSMTTGIGWRKKLQSLLIVLVPLSMASATSYFVLKRAASFQETKTAYGNLTERINMVQFDKGKDHRLPLWKSALDYISHHPLMGAGYGNWKLASIPYEKVYTKDLEVTYHAHNDFLEAGAETGILGLFLFSTIFVIGFYNSFKTIQSRVSGRLSALAAFGAMGLVIYAVDAFFNFPAERPVMQFFFAFVLALLVQSHREAIKGAVYYTPQSGITKLAISVTCFLLLLPSLWYQFTTYRSMVAQYSINPDMQAPQPVKTYEEVEESLPSVPDLDINAFPINAIKARYLIRDKKYEEALNEIEIAKKANPFLPFDDLLKAQVFLATNKWDSASYHAKMGLQKRPKSAALYQVFNAIHFKMKDTGALKQAFQNFIRYRNEPWVWNEYLNYSYDLPHDKKNIHRIIDEGVKLFPTDKDLIHKKNFLSNAP